MNRKATGVTYIKKKKTWLARIAFHGVRYSLGTHKNYDDAVATYKAAAKAGCVAVKAWCNTPVEYRGKIGEEMSMTSAFQEEEAILRLFSTIKDSKENDKDLLSW